MLFVLETPSIGQVFLSMHASAMLLALEVRHWLSGNAPGYDHL